VSTYQKLSFMGSVAMYSGAQKVTKNSIHRETCFTMSITSVLHIQFQCELPVEL
jgi:hypothetical protein